MSASANANCYGGGMSLLSSAGSCISSGEKPG